MSTGSGTTVPVLHIEHFWYHCDTTAVECPCSFKFQDILVPPKYTKLRIVSITGCTTEKNEKFEKNL